MIVRWECKATAFAQRSDYVLLFSSEFIEIRHAQSGRLMQVIEGTDIRLLNCGPPENMPLILARLGKTNDETGQSDELFELIKTSPLSSPTSPSSPRRWSGGPARVNSSDRDLLWNEWDM